MGGFRTTRMTFSIFTIVIILFVLCLYRYLKWYPESLQDVITNHEINPRFRSREYVILLLIFIIECIFLIEDVQNGNEPLLTSGVNWGFTLIELQLLLVWYLQEQRQISELNMILRILSLSFTLFFGWVFLLFLLFHDIELMRSSLYMIFGCNLILSICSIVHNVVFKYKIKWIKIQSPLKPWLVNIILCILAAISLFEMIAKVPLNESESRQTFKAITAFYRILTFICILFICWMITIRRTKDDIKVEVGGKYKEGDIPDEFHGRTLSLVRSHNKYSSQIKLAQNDSHDKEEESLQANEAKEEEKEVQTTNKIDITRLAIPELMDGFKKIEVRQRDDNKKAMETMYEYGRREGNKPWQTVAATFIGGENVGKTRLIRALWKLDITDVDPKRKKYKKKKKHQETKQSETNVDDDDIDEGYDEYNMIDLYRRWDPDLKIKFKFWDTVGDVRFLNSILKCMLTSEVIVALYTLEGNTNKAKHEDTEEKEAAAATNKLMDVHQTVKFLLAVEAGIRALVSVTGRQEKNVKPLQFAVLLVGISKQPISSRLEKKNEQVFKFLFAHCKHLRFIPYGSAKGPSPIFYINYDLTQPAMTCLVQILWSIYQVKKSALNNGFISDSRICCGLIKRPNAPIYSISDTLAHNIKRQPFVLRKIDVEQRSVRARALKKTFTRRGSVSMSIGMHVNKLQKREKRQVVGGPIASVHHWKLHRPKATIFIRTLGCLISGIFFPFLVVMQTVMFWCYCAEWGISNEGLSRIVSNKQISQYGTYLLDFLYPIFPRFTPDPAVESAINTGLRSLLTQKSGSKSGVLKIDWFFRQTSVQKIFRTLIAFSIVLLATFLVYNLVYWINVDEAHIEVSTAESIGGLFWFGIIWLMMGSWYGHRVDVIPDVDAMFADEDRTSFRLHYKDTSFGKDLIHTNVEVFLRSYTFYHAANKKNEWVKPLFFVIIGIIYALIPGLHRVMLQDKPFIVEEHPYTVTRALVSNFVLVTLVNYVFDKAFFSYFEQYARLIFDVTTLIEIPGDDQEEEDPDEEVDDDNEFKRPSYLGSGFEFLSLDDPENLISWLEIRSYAYVKGRQLFAELELFILFFCIFMIFMAGFVVLTLFEYAGEDAPDAISGTFLCVIFMLLINFGWMMKVFILGTKFDQLQRRQLYAMVNQMTCIRAEALTTAVFTGPIGWIELNVGAWDKLYCLLHERRKKVNRREKKRKGTNAKVGAMLNFEMDLDEANVSDEEAKEFDDVYENKYKKLRENVKRYFSDQHREEEKWKEMRSLQEDFDHYLDLLELAYYKIQQNSIHPKIFGLGLSGALMKTMAAATFTTVFAVVRFVFIA